LIVGALDENPCIDEEQLTQEIFGELKMKLSIDEEFVSMNALELFTRGDSERGLQKAINELVNECV
jgi:hypothetical protein